MPFAYLRRLFSDASPAQPRIEPGIAQAGASEPSPFGHTGAAFVPVRPSELLKSSDDILRRIKLCYGREPPQFEQDILAVVARYADFVNALPATANNYYSYPGGLFRLGLDTAFFSLQATDAQIFEGRGTITQRRHLEPRWRHATFIAGLCAALQSTLDSVSVATPDGDCWPSYLQPLSSWLDRYRDTAFHLTWRTPGHVDGLQNLYALPHIIPPTTMEYLADRNNVVVPTMLAALSRLPLSNPPATMGALVRRAVVLVIGKDLRRMASSQGTTLQGAHLGRLLVDIMHDLVHSSASWGPNAEKSRIWHAADGTFVVWPGAFQDIVGYADHERLHGLPSSPESAITALETAGMVVDAEDGPHWPIRIPGASSDLRCLKLAAPELVLGAQLATCPPLPPVSVQRESPRPAQNRPASAPPQQAAKTTTAQCDGPTQLELSLAQPPSENPSPVRPTSVQSKPEAQNTPSLVHCMRLPADVAAAVKRAIASLSANAESTGVTMVREGILIPMQVFKSAGLDTKMVSKCLRDADMLVVGESGNPTYTLTLKGTEVRGLVLKRQFIIGLPSPTATPEAPAC